MGVYKVHQEDLSHKLRSYNVHDSFVPDRSKYQQLPHHKISCVWLEIRHSLIGTEDNITKESLLLMLICNFLESMKYHFQFVIYLITIELIINKSLLLIKVLFVVFYSGPYEAPRVDTLLTFSAILTTRYLVRVVA